MPIDVSATMAALDSIGVRVRQGTREGVDVGLDWVQTFARINVKKVTGELAASIERFGPFPGDSPDTWVGRVQPTVIYGRIQELGGRIFPKYRRALAFYWPGHAVEPVLLDGRVLIRTYVYHRAEPYLKPAVEETKAIWRESIIVEWRKSLRYYA